MTHFILLYVAFTPTGKYQNRTARLDTPIALVKFIQAERAVGKLTHIVDIKEVA